MNFLDTPLVEVVVVVSYIIPIIVVTIDSLVRIVFIQVLHRLHYHQQ